MENQKEKMHQVEMKIIVLCNTNETLKLEHFHAQIDVPLDIPECLAPLDGGDHIAKALILRACLKIANKIARELKDVAQNAEEVPNEQN